MGAKFFLNPVPYLCPEKILVGSRFILSWHIIIYTHTQLMLFLLTVLDFSAAVAGDGLKKLTLATNNHTHTHTHSHTLEI